MIDPGVRVDKVICLSIHGPASLNARKAFCLNVLGFRCFLKRNKRNDRERTLSIYTVEIELRRLILHARQG